MSKLSYLARVMSGVRLKKMNQMIDVVHDKCGQNKVKTFFDMCWCGARYGAGYYDYVMFGFYNMNGRQRDTYLTRVRNKKVIDHMNDLSYSDEFDDKLRFNQRFAKYLGRKTLNGETATLAEFTDFIAGQEAIFAKINHGDSGRGVERLRVADFESPAAMLTSAGRTKLSLQEISLADIQLPQQAVKTVRDTVPSLRLDGIISSGFSISRGKAADYVSAGKAELNYLPCMKGDKQVSEGDLVSVRGLGKLRLEKVGGNTKKGRISIEISRFL